jgi:hypothetical protein
MEINFVVGKKEKHAVEFRWGQFFGTSSVSVDGEVVLRGKPKGLEEVSRISTPLRRYKYLYDVVVKGDLHIQRLTTWDLEVGTREKHTISIVKERPTAFAALRPHLYRVLVDGDLLLEKSGY